MNGQTISDIRGHALLIEGFANGIQSEQLKIWARELMRMTLPEYEAGDTAEPVEVKAEPVTAARSKEVDASAAAKFFGLSGNTPAFIVSATGDDSLTD